MLHLVVFGDEKTNRPKLIKSTKLLLWPLRGDCGDSWFYYQMFFAQKRDHFCTHHKELLMLVDE